MPVASQNSQERSTSLRSTLIRPRFSNKRPIIMISVVLALVASMILFLWQQAASVINTSEQLSETRDFLSCLDNTLSTVRDAENSQRGYIVTGDDSYRRTYQISKLALNSYLDQLGRLTLGDAKKTNQVDNLRTLLRQKISVMDTTIALRKRNMFRDSWLVAVSSRGKLLMDQITSTIGTMRWKEEALLADNTKRVRETNRMILSSLPVILLSICFMIGILIWLCFKYFLDKKMSEARLAHAYQLFENFMDNSPGIAYIKDQHGKYIYTNKNLEDMFARDGLPIIGRRDIDWLPQDLAEKVDEHDRKVLSANHQIQTIEVLPGDETDREQTWYVIKFPVTDLAGTKFIAGVAVNVSDMKKQNRKSPR